MRLPFPMSSVWLVLVLKKDYYFDISSLSLLSLFFLQHSPRQCRDDFLRVSIVPRYQQSSLLPPPEVLHHHPPHTEERSGLSHRPHHQVSQLLQLTHCKSTTSSLASHSAYFTFHVWTPNECF